MASEGAAARGDSVYKVVINHEEQYSIWPADRGTPKGWKDVGREGTRREMLAYIEEVWTDMRPLALTLHAAYEELQRQWRSEADD